MKRIVGIMFVLVVLCNLGNLCSLWKDKQALRDQLVRLHVVGATNDQEDQNIKLLVRDTVLTFLDENMPKDLGIEEAKAYLGDHLTEIEEAANQRLVSCDSTDRAIVTLMKEEFPVRKYTTFSLPSGIYESLRVTIGPGEGKNWWCVVFPSFCMGTTRDEFHDIAVGAGFSEDLFKTVSQEEGYEIRFFLLDCFGKLENLFHFR